MSKDRKALLAQLTRIHDRRQEARRRELSQQRAQLSQAECDLQAQREREAAAAQRFAQIVQRVGDDLQQGSFTAADALRLQGYLSVQRTLVESESTASEVAQSIVKVAESEVEQARGALRQARTATQKAQTMHDRVAQQVDQAAQVRAEIDVDGANMDAHARRGGGA
jgi:hypothetical protein